MKFSLQARSRAARRRRIALVLLGSVTLSPWVISTPALAGPAIDFGDDAGSGCGPNNVEGWEFQAVADMTVSALGTWDDDLAGLDHPTPVGFYDSSCQLLASTTVPAGTAAVLSRQYRYVGITPVDLSAGETYRIAALVMCGDDTPDFTSLTTVTIDPALSAVQTRRIPGASALACPTETSKVFSFSPNFLIGPPCGNGIVEAGEECDDDNTIDGDCCSATCTLPVAACRAAQKSQLLLKDDPDDDARDKLVWKWAKGDPTSQVELGDPTATADYNLCVYESTGLMLSVGIPADATKWSAIRDKGYRYRDVAGTENGFTSAVLRGSTQSKAKALLKGKGSDLPDPTLGDLSLPLSVQLRNRETGLCLEAVYDTADVTKNDPGEFRARAR